MKMKFTTIVGMIACASMASESVARQASFYELGEELRMLSSNPQVQQVSKSVLPLAKQMGLGDSTIDNLDLSPGGLLSKISALENSCVAFHSAVDNAGGFDTFVESGNLVTKAYVAGLLGHLNAANVESAYIERINNALQKVLAQTAGIAYNDLYKVVNADLVNGLIPDFLEVSGPFSKVVADFRDLAAKLKDLFGGEHRVLFEKIEALGDSTLRVLEQDEQHKNNFICKLEPLILDVTGVMYVLTADIMISDIGYLANALANHPGDNKFMVFLQKATMALYKALEKYGPTINKDVLPYAIDMDFYIDGLCKTNSTTLRALGEKSSSVVKFDPFSVITTLFDFLENILVAFVDLSQHMPQPITGDMLKLIYDIVALLAPSKAGDLKAIFDDIENLSYEAALLVQPLNATLNQLETFVVDSFTTVLDVKSLIVDIISLLRAIAHKN